MKTKVVATIALTIGLCVTMVTAGEAPSRAVVAPFGTDSVMVDTRPGTGDQQIRGVGPGLQAGADHILGQQCATGAWCWEHGSACCPNPAYSNIISPIGMGLLNVYSYTADAAHLAACEAGADYDMNFQYGNGEYRSGSFSPGFLYTLSQATSNSAYSSHAETEFFDELTAKTYGPTDLDTYGWVAAVQTSRSGAYINLRPWDLHQLPWAAGLLGNADSTSPPDSVSQQSVFLGAVLSGLDTLDNTKAWDLLGLAGGVRGLAINGTTSFAALNSPGFPAIDTATTLCAVADALAGYQNADGSWSWNSTLQNPVDPTDKDTQTTAYAVLALIAAQAQGCGPYASAIDTGRDFLRSMQLPDGGFLSYPGGAENTEVEGEALWALAPDGCTDNVLEFVVLPASECVQPGETVTVELRQRNLQLLVTGFQAFAQFDSSVLTWGSTTYTATPYGLPVLPGTPVGDDVDLAAGINQLGGQPPTQADALLATLVFTVGSAEGPTTVSFRAHNPPSRFTDPTGNNVTPCLVESSTILVDGTDPVITCPGDLTVECDEATDPSKTGYATATDNLDPNPDVTYSDVETPGTCAQEKTITRTWTAEDCAGNTHSCVQTITVADTTAPVLTCPANVTVECDESTDPGSTGITENLVFDVDPILSPTQAPGVWYTDRYAPSGFVSAVLGGDNRLKHSIAASDGASSRPGGYSGSFYDTQGRKYDLAAGTTRMTIDLYVPNDWATTGRRMAGFWGTAFDAGDAVSAYPIIEFTSSSDGSGLPRFRGWNDAAGWVDMGLPTGFTYDAWYTLEIELVGSSFVYTVGDLTLAVSALGSARLGNVILQGHNTSSGVTYDIYWDNFVAAQMTMAVDNCDPAPVVTYSDVETPGSCPQEKTITRTWTATDACGNSSSCAQTITVQDTTAPVISCPDDFTVECEDDVPAAYADLAAFLAAGGTADDNCDTDLTLSLTSDTGLVGGICGGTVTRVYRVTDDCGNHHECSQEITVDDTIAPVITCPDDVVVNADAGGCDAIVDLGGKRCFGDYTFHSSYGAGHFDDVFDLTRYDVTLTYSIDLSQVTQTAAYETPYAEVGLRQVGAGDFNPGPWDTYQGGAGGWMTSLVGDLATNPNLLDLDDKHNLGASGGRGESDYDVYASAPSVVVAPPFGSFNTRYIWFDRDGVDPYQDTKGANSGGTYDITIRYHAINAGLGTMIATINGNGVDTVHQEFLVGGTYYPGGLSFKGNMTQMQLFYGAWYTGGAGGPVTVSNMCLTASARATDNCDPNPAITAVRSDSLPLTDPYPSGVTTITWTATDACGNSASCDQTVTVVAQNELVVDVQLKNVYEPTLTRCITFELFDCSGAGSVVVSQDITFTTGLATGVSILVPCGDYDCITARDVLHTLRRTDDDGDFGISGSQYVADFTSSGVSDDSLIGGNLNDDEYIDILDFGTFSWQWNVNYGTGDTTCSTAAPHADISGNGVVFTEDFSFIQTNFLTFREPNCCSLPGKKVAAGAEGPTTEISVAELRQRGLGYLAVADLNGDGWLDVDDVAAFQQGVRPKPTPGVLEQEAVELPAAMEAVPQGAAAPRSSGGRR